MGLTKWVMFATLLSASTCVWAADIDGRAVIGGALGGAAGAAVGSAVGGRGGAVIGAGIGGATGAAVATSGKSTPAPVTTVVQREVVVVHEDEWHDNGKHKGQHKHHYHDD
jgi:outer membrane lipoprotein SlyB